MPQKVVIPYHPRPLQRKLHNDLKRFNVINCHRRLGKTCFSINHLIRSALTNKLKNRLSEKVFICIDGYI